MQRKQYEEAAWVRKQLSPEEREWALSLLPSTKEKLNRAGLVSPAGTGPGSWQQPRVMGARCESRSGWVSGYWLLLLVAFVCRSLAEVELT